MRGMHTSTYGSVIHLSIGALLMTSHRDPFMEAGDLGNPENSK